MTKSAFGVQVDAWAALVPGKGGIADDIQKLVWEGLTAKVPTLQAREDDTNRVLALSHDWLKFSEMGDWFKPGRTHILVTDTTNRFERYTVALRVAKWGDTDVELSWRLFEKDFVFYFEQWASIGIICIALFIGVFNFLTSLGRDGLFLALGTNLSFIAGAIIVVAAMRWLIDRSRMQSDGTRRTWLRTFDQFDSRMLALAISAVLWEALDTQAVMPSEVKEVYQMQRSRAGMIGAKWKDI